MRKEAGFGVWVAASLLVFLTLSPVLYVLSIGPAARLANADMLHEEAAEIFYTPLILLAEVSEPVNGALAAYVEWWDPSTLPVPANAPLPVMVPPPPPVQPDYAPGMGVDYTPAGG